jgi:hypothetical protein
MQPNRLHEPPHYSDLIEKYFEGETSLAEEKMLKAYFASSEVKPEHQALAPLFTMLREEQITVLPEKTRVVQPKQSFWTTSRMLAAAAALLLLTASAWWWNSKNTPQPDHQPVAESVQDDKKAPRDEQQLLAESAPENAPAAVTEQPQTSKPRINQKRRSAPKAQPRPVLASKPDPEAEAAMEEIKSALSLISRKINKGRKETLKGIREVEHLDKGIEKIKENS